MNSNGKSRSPATVIVLMGLLFGIAFMGADIMVISLRPLNYLGVRYPPILRYTHIILPPVVFILWLLLGRRWPKITAAIAFILCGEMISGVARWADRQVEKVNITTSITDITPLENRLGFKVWETGNSSGEQLWVAREPGHAQQLTAEATRMGIFRP